MKPRQGGTPTGLLLVLSMVLGAVTAISLTVAAPEPAEAGVYFNDTEFTYKEYWADHDTYTGGCGDSATSGNTFYIEPDDCTKTIELAIPDDTSTAIAAVIYVDLWRNRPSRSARFTVNDGPQYRPPIGTNFSRTPFQATIPLTQLEQGTNVLKFQEATGPYHVHDVMIRVYYDDTMPLIPGPNSDVAPPSGALTSVQAVGGPVIDPAAGGALAVDGNQVLLTATAAGAAYVEFHGFYDGYDEDNDGETRDWHNFLRNNFGPGGTEERPTGATIGHIGTDASAPYQATWNLPQVVNQDGVKFKVRVVDNAGNVREAASGISAEFTLQRSYSVEAYTIPNFPDQALYFDGAFPQDASVEIDLPTDLDQIDRAILLGNYWNSPDISINDRPPFPAFQGPEDVWTTSRRDLDPSILEPGPNTIRYNYRPPGFGAMVEDPGPMIVIHRAPPSGPPVVTRPPSDVLISAGQAATLTVAATGEPILAYQWMLDGVAIPGASSSTYSTPALTRSNDGSKYSVTVSNAAGSVTSTEATVNVAAPPTSDAPWWDDGWDYRVPLTAFPESIERNDKVVEQFLDFSALMAAAGAGGPTFDVDSLRVVEVDDEGVLVDAAVPFQFDPAGNFNAVSNATGTLIWQLTGTTPKGVARSYHVYFDKTYKSIPAASVASQVTRTDVVDEGYPAYRFDLADDSEWYFHTAAGGGFSKIIDTAGNDWIAWNKADGTAGDFRGFPNAVKPPTSYFHPGRPKKTSTKIIDEGPLKITFEVRARDSSWIAIYEMYPTYNTFAMTRANTRFWVQYEGLPGGEVDSGDFLQRSDGVTVPIDGTFESDLPGQEWMYLADPADDRSFYIAHHQDDGAVESYRLLNGEMPIMAFGRGGLNLNSQYLQKVIDGEPQLFMAGLVDGTAFGPTGDAIRGSYKEVSIVQGAADFDGERTGPMSDDFSGATLSPFWTYTDPVGDTTLTLTGSNLLIDMPEGPSHDLWTDRDFAPRLLQDVGDDDLDVVAGFDSTPTEQFQGQGLLFVEDEDNWLRATVDHDGTRAKFVVYRMVDGEASQLAKKNLPGVATRYVRAIRTGNTWSFQRSYNGSRWFALNNLNIPFDLTQVGVYGTAHGSTSPAYVTSVDYFESKTSGNLADDAPQLSNIAVDSSSRSATVSWTTNVPADTRLDHGPTSGLGTVDVDTELSTEHSVTIDYLRCGAPYFVRPRSTSDIGTTIGDVISFTTDACATVVSDDFSTGDLGPHWTVFDPLGDTTLDLSATNAIISVPGGVDHNLFTDENFATRLRQEGPIGDFEVEAKFESVLTSRFQTQGIVVEEDDDSYLRFEIHHDGTGTKAFVASVLDNNPTIYFSGALPTTSAQYVRVGRVGNTWKMSYSTDGVTFTELVSMVVGIESAYVGPYIGNTATGSNTPPAFIGSIDYFFNTANPIDPEDGGAGPDLTPPAISNVAVVPGSPTSQSAEVTWTTDEPSTTRVDWGLTTAYGAGPFVENTAVRNHSTVIEPLICGATYHARVSSTDASGNTSQSTNQVFATPACPANAFSDNFDDPALDPRWFVDDPRKDSSYELLNGLLSMSVPQGVRHDLTANNNGAFRMLQAVPDGDFQVRVGFESVVNFGFQIQGIVFETDDDNLIRFDLFSDGATTKAFVGTLTAPPARLRELGNIGVPGAVPGSLQVTRTGNNWLFEYSPDRGDTWQTVYQGVIDMSVARMGPTVGNANPQIANVPPHTGLIDYFWSAADPIEITEPGILDGPEFTIFGGTGVDWNGEALRFGSPGLTQPDINIRGRVTDADGVASLTYRVNGGEPIAMGVGSTDCLEGISCTRRLALDGDFNADVNANLLTPGSNVITLRAVDDEFNATSIEVPVEYTPATDWPLPYSVDWSSVDDLYDVSQPVDGRWVVSGDTVGIDEIGYDRLLTFGDDTWSSFEAQVDVTINGFDPAGYAAPSGGPGVGFIPHWTGHTQEGFAQPKYGFSGQLGALVWYRYRDDINAERLEIRDSNALLVAEDLSGRTLTEGVTYTFKMQAETGGGDGPLYRLKVWEQGTAEPTEWNIVTALPPGVPDHGSLALVAHHVDADFGDLDVRQITAAAPTITPESGVYTGLAKVEMATGTRAGEIRYTLDGSDPTESSTLYTEPFFVNNGATVRARTFRAGFVPSSTVDRTYQITAPPDRVTDALQAIYRFDEDGGNSVADTALTGDPLDLVIEDGSDVTWLPDLDALRINGASSIRTPLGGARLNNAVKDSQSLSVEMWIDPATFEIDEGTLFNISNGAPGQQNLALSQAGRTLDMALRTTASDGDGKYSLNSGGIVPSQLHHLVYVRRPDNVVDLYIDGVLAWSGWRGGSLNGWSSGFPISIANSFEGINPWIGDMYLMAVYSDDLTSAQVVQNYQSGPFPPPANFAPVVDAGPDVTVVQGEVATMAASSIDDGNPTPPGALSTSWSLVSGPAPVSFSDATSPTSTVTLTAPGQYVLEWLANDGEKSDADQMQITVIPAESEAPAPVIDPPGGSYPGSVVVTMSTSVPGGTIRYTLDGSEPTPTSDEYSGEFELTASTVVSARVFRDGLLESPVAVADYQITPDSRAEDGLLVLYPFNEPNGGSIKDKGPLSGLLNLRIENVGKTTRVTSGLRIDEPTVITSTSAASKVTKPIKASSEVSVELWVSPSDIPQSDAELFGISANGNARNIAMIQDGADLDTYLRTKNTDASGAPPTEAGGVLGAAMHHVVFTRDASGATTVYVDGNAVAAGQVGNNLGNWVNTHRLHLGAERDGSRAWLGTYYMVAIFDRALTPAEVVQNYAFGEV